MSRRAFRDWPCEPGSLRMPAGLPSGNLYHGRNLVPDFFDHVRVRGSDVVTFIRILIQVVELGMRQHIVANATGRRRHIGCRIVPCDMQFPVVPSSALNVPVIEIQQRSAIDCRCPSGKKRPDVDAIQRFVR